MWEGQSTLEMTVSVDIVSSLFCVLRTWSIMSTGLDMEYRYWSFMEAHPAHMSLPANARMDAMDALSWAYAGA